MTDPARSFADYKADAHNWITLATGEYYPDILKDACALYSPVVVHFGQLLKQAESSERLFMLISCVPNSWMRVQLCRVFRKYVSPETPVEMLRVKTKAARICSEFGSKFRAINEVQAAYDTRPNPDEPLCAVLWEYKDRGTKGYDLTDRFFDFIESCFQNVKIMGPRGAGPDIPMGRLFKDYPNPKKPVDFAIFQKDVVLAVGWARYDSDRGGAQEDDRTGGYFNCANEFDSYASQHSLNTKIIFINDGPGLLLGSMWDDYAKLEASWPHRVIVLTLRMLKDRLTFDWLTKQD